MENLPISLDLLFGTTVLLTIALLFKATEEKKWLIVFLLGWFSLHSVLGLTGFYTSAESIPSRFVWMVGPAIAVMFFLFFSVRGLAFTNGLDLRWLLVLHVVRLPVEFVIWALYQYGLMPRVMTFEGVNFDFISGFSAPLMFLLYFYWKKVGPLVFLAWNALGLILLFNVVYHAVFSLPTSFQKFSFEQPNVAIMYFPYIFLPGFIVPVVLYSHIALIRRTIREMRA
jgi:hypothetical protein